MPLKDKVVSMVKRALNAVISENITHLFEVCGITTSDIDVNNCTKLDGLTSMTSECLRELKPTIELYNI